jgi:hypothetical protein
LAAGSSGILAHSGFQIAVERNRRPGAGFPIRKKPLCAARATPCEPENPLAFAAMLWLMIGLLVSLLVLLVAAAGLVHHVIQCAKLRHRPVAATGTTLDQVEESDQELEP